MSLWRNIETTWCATGISFLARECNLSKWHNTSSVCIHPAWQSAPDQFSDSLSRTSLRSTELNGIIGRLSGFLGRCSFVPDTAPWCGTQPPPPLHTPLYGRRVPLLLTSATALSKLHCHRTHTGAHFWTNARRCARTCTHPRHYICNTSPPLLSSPLAVAPLQERCTQLYYAPIPPPLHHLHPAPLLIHHKKTSVGRIISYIFFSGNLQCS